MEVWVTFSAMLDNVVVLFEFLIRQFNGPVMHAPHAGNTDVAQRTATFEAYQEKAKIDDVGWIVFCVLSAPQQTYLGQYCHNFAEHGSSIEPKTCSTQRDLQSLT